MKLVSFTVTLLVVASVVQAQVGEEGKTKRTRALSNKPRGKRGAAKKRAANNKAKSLGEEVPTTGRVQDKPHPRGEQRAYEPYELDTTARTVDQCTDLENWTDS